MKWIGSILLYIGIYLLIFVGPRHGFIPLLLGIILYSYWYLAEREPPPEFNNDSDDFAPDHPHLHQPIQESSSSFDLPDFGPFLQNLLPHLASGFTQRHIDHLTSLANRMRHEEQQEAKYNVTLRSQIYPLRIELFKDDINEITAYFFAPKPLTDLIDSEMNSFFLQRDM